LGNQDGELRKRVVCARGARQSVDTWWSRAKPASNGQLQIDTAKPKAVIMVTAARCVKDVVDDRESDAGGEIDEVLI
jgi:hypothetical protein